MRRNTVILAGLVIGHLVVLYALNDLARATADWTSEARIGIAAAAYLMLGAISFHLFRGRRSRYVWVAAAVALPLLLDEAISFIPTAYSGLGFVVAPVLVLVALVGALARSLLMFP